MKSKLISLTMPLFFIAFALWILSTATSMGKIEGTFPKMVGVFMLVVALFQFGSDLRRSDHRDKFRVSGLLKVIEVVVILFLYVFMLNRIGYMIDTTLLALYIMFSLGYRNFRAVPLAATFAAVAFIVFKVLLSVPLPMLFFDF